MSERNHFTLGWHVGVCAPTLCALLIACSGNVTTDPAPNGEDLPSTGGGSDVVGEGSQPAAGDPGTNTQDSSGSPSGSTSATPPTAPPGTQELEPSPPPGNALRLTRSELDHALRDLLHDDSNPASRFLAEDEYSPFDNDASRQVVSPTLIESVHALAQEAAERLANDVESRAQWMPCSPQTATDAECFDMTATRLARSFFRRDVAASELQDYRRFLDFAEEAGDFYFGVELLLSALIQDPEFLYRLERPTDGKLNGAEIATRLSFTLWGSVPDAALLDDAASGVLATSEGRADAARRMLTSDSSMEQLFRFHAMWLGYRAIPHDAELNAAFQLETQALLSRVLFEEPQSYLALFESTETYLTEALAQHYGLPAPDGPEGWVTYPEGSGRAGVLSHGSVLSAFSKFDDTSPTQRGIFIRTRLLCQNVPPPPPAVDVDQPPGGSEAEAECKLDRYRAHREQSGCMECHALFDPIGEGLERFDRAGRFREHDDADENCVLDGEGELPGSGAFNGPAELASLLVADGAIQSCLTQQLLSYARGTSSLSPDDRTFAAEMAESLEAEGLVLTDWIPRWVADERFVQPMKESP